MKGCLLAAFMILEIGTTVLFGQVIQLTADNYAKALKDSLGLTEEQVKQIHIIHSNALAAVGAVLQSSGVDERFLLAKIKEISEEADEKIAALLNSDQRRRLNEMKERSKTSRGDLRRRGQRG